MNFVEEKFRKINVWKRGEERAPHKPLLVLYMLGRYFNGGERTVAYAEADKKLKELLKEFGPFRKSYHPELPFWYLQNDGLWELENADNLVIRKGSSNPLRSEMMSHNVEGGFPPEIYGRLKKDRSLVFKIANAILTAHFPPTYHDDILQAVGLDAEIESYSRRKRNPDFREMILRAYRYKCAVCGFDIKLGREPVALEAAHIKWHQAGGPDREPNGLALCSLHHKLFDRGAFTLTESMQIRVSEYAHGGKGFEDWLLKFDRQRINPPQRQVYFPEEEFLYWHVREVFKGPDIYKIER